MDLTTYEKIVKSEKAAERYLLKFCWKNHQRFCPRCRIRKLYVLGNGKRRCARCKYTFHDFSGRFINSGNLTSLQWLRIIKLFELGVPAAKMVEQTGLAPNTVNKALSAIRRAIFVNALDAPLILEIYPNLAGGGGRGAAAGNSQVPPPVFGVVERKGWVFVDFINGLNAESLIHFKLNFMLKTASLGNIIYTDRYQQYDALMSCGGLIQDRYPVKHRDRGLYIDQSNRFWSFAKERLKMHKGLSPERFVLFLKEMEFRYNYRNEDIFQTVVEYLCSFVPNRIIRSSI